MTNQPRHIYKFGLFSLDPAKRVLVKDGRPIPLTPKAFDTLLVLVRKNGDLVEKDELLREIWPDTFVEESTLAQNIFTLRKALGQKGETNQIIETVPRHGYRFAADVQILVNEPAELIFEKHTTTKIVSEEIESNGHDARLYSDRPADMNERHQGSALILDTKTRPSRLRRLMTPTRLIVLGLALVACAVGGWIAVKSRLGILARPDLTSTMHIRRLTNNGHVVRATVSDDSSYVAYAVQEGEQQSLWLRQVDATTNIQVMAPAKVLYQGITFARDHSSIYFVQYAPPDPIGKLFQIPLLGGTPRTMISDVDSKIALSPDGKRVAFFRADLKSGEKSVMTAALDGSNERKLVSHAGAFSGDGPAWSPDGKTLAYPLYADGNPNRYNSASLMSLRVEDGFEQAITKRQWESIGSVAWFGSSDLVLVAFDETTEAFSPQLWRVSVINGETSRITNDLNSYSGLSVSPPASALVTIQADRIANFWIADGTEPNRATEITGGVGDKGGEVLGLAWASNERIVYGSSAGGNLDIWAMDANGDNRKQLTVDPKPDLKAAVSPLDGSIVFVSKRTGTPHLWSMAGDGLNLKQLTNGKTESYPSFSPDGNWVAFISIEDDATLWKLSMSTGERQQLTKSFSWMPNVSPDGKSIACFYNEGTLGTLRIAVIPSDGGQPTKLLDIPPGVFLNGGVRWSPDGRAITYIKTERETSNIWSQPIDGKPAQPLTHFDSGQIFRFAWSPNGKRLVFERGSNSRDVILITDFVPDK